VAGRPWIRIAAPLALLVAGATSGCAGASAGGSAARPTVRVLVLARPYGQPIPAGFLGLSIEYPAIMRYAGTNPVALDPVFEALVRNLTPGQAQVLRIGGDSTDRTWWPVAGMSKPGGVTFALGRRWLAVTATLTRALGARVILGIDLEADSTIVAATEARMLVAGIGRGAVMALEPGNEPELYDSHLGWYRKDGVAVPGRPPGYTFSSFLSDFRRVSAALPPVPLAGPSIGGPEWLSLVLEFLRSERSVGVVTVHQYPMQLCGTQPPDPRYPTIAHLLARAAARVLAQDVAPDVAVARRLHVPLRVDEMNTISCGYVPAVGESFAAALWAPDALFELAKVGVDGVNVHTYPHSGYGLFTFKRAGGRWSGTVAPEYYGLLLFARAAPPGSRLLSTKGGGSLKVWATRARGRIRVVLLNDSGRREEVGLRIDGASGPASVDWLQAPSAAAQRGVTLDGVGFGARTATGTLPPLHPATATPSGGGYLVAVPATSAALLTVGLVSARSPRT
jgi:hypothetical protein